LFERDWAFANRKAAEAPEAARPAAAGGAQLIASGPDQADDTVYSVLVAAAYQARRRIALATPYFVPDSALLMALSLAARRGVAVDLLLPARSNHRLSDLARNRALRSLSAAGARIWLAQGMTHAKLAVFDDALALAGSVNLDSRSLFLNYELMFAFHQSADVQRFAAWFDQECAPAKSYVATPPGLVRDMAEGMLLWLAFQL
jgi:cardiolipin synthase